MSENQRFSDVSRGYRNGMLDQNRLINEFFANGFQYSAVCSGSEYIDSWETLIKVGKNAKH